MSARTTLIVAALLGFAGVALGAFGAHGLKAILTPAQLLTWQTAVQYHFYHTLLLLGIGLWMNQIGGARALTLAAILVILGIILFSGSLYLICLLQWRVLGPITPIGGLCLMAGWVMLIPAAWSGLRSDRQL